MKKCGLAVYAYAIFLFLTGFCHAEAPAEVLLLHSYHQGLSWTDNITTAIQDTFDGQPVVLNIEYLDSKRNTLASVDAPIFTYLSEKYRLRPPAAVIAADNNALTFLRNHRDTLFPSSTIIFCGINNYSPEMLEGLEGRVTGVTEETDPAGTVRLMQDLQPGLQRVVVISGETTTSRMLRISARQALEPFSHALKLEWWEGLSIDEVTRRVHSLSTTDAVLLLTFNRDSAGTYFSYETSGRMITAASRAPVYGLWDFYVDTGVIGGRMAVAKNQGTVAADICLKYLKTGHLPPVITVSPNTTLVNYEALRHHGLSAKRLPPTATVLNPPSSNSQDRYFKAAMVTLILFASLCILYAVATSFRHKRTHTLSLLLRNNTVALLGMTVCGILLVLISQEYMGYSQALEQARNSLLTQKKAALKSEVEHTLERIDLLRNSANSGATNTTAALQASVLKGIRECSYDDDRGYLFILTEDGDLLAHPRRPDLEGQNIKELQDAQGTHIFSELLAAVQHPNGGFVNYEWQDTAETAPSKKLSYAKQVKDWNWIVATGVMLNDIDSVLLTQKQILKTHLTTRVLSILLVSGLSLLFFIIISRYITRQVETELEALHTGASTMDANSLKGRFTIREFQSIADGAIAAFNEAACMREKFTKAFQKNVAIMSISTVRDGRLIEVNEAFLQVMGYTEAEALGKTSVELGIISEQFRDSVIANFSASGDSGIVEAEFRDKQGNLHIGEFRAQLIALDREKCVLSVVHDITDRKAAQDQAFQLFRAVEQSPVSVVITDLEGNIEYVNPTFCSVTGYTKDEALGQNPRLLKSGEISTDRYAELWETISLGKEWRGEFHNKRKDGTFFWEAATISGIRDAHGIISHYLAVKEDITEKKVLEIQLAQSQKLESVGQLAAGIAHEINTPIQFVGDNLRFLQDSVADLLSLADTHADLIKQAHQTGGIDETTLQKQKKALDDADIDYLNEELPAAIKQALEGTDRVSKIVRAMKNFSHPGSTEMSSANLNEAIETTLTVTKNEWKYVAEIERHFDEHLPMVPCLISEFNQVILNIIVNARDAIEETGKTGTITVSTQQDDRWVTIRISDNGTGMPDSVQSRIFDPFYTTKEVGKGTGQGLAIAHNVIVKKHGGLLSVKSESGKGTTFEIKLPLQR